MTARIILILAVASMIVPSLANGSPACMTISEARAKFPKEHLVWGRHQPLLDIRSSAHAFATTRTRGRARAFPTTRTVGRAFLPTRNR
jgi:hypothetical protein